LFHKISFEHFNLQGKDEHIPAVQVENVDFGRYLWEHTSRSAIWVTIGRQRGFKSGAKSGLLIRHPFLTCLGH
jgi:hypothetical protein